MEGATHYPIMEEGVQVSKDVSSLIMPIFLNEGLVKKEEAGLIEGRSQERQKINELFQKCR